MPFSYSYRYMLVSVLLSAILVGCKSNSQESESVNYGTLEKQLLKFNSQFVALENENINKFIDSRGWEMAESGSGLRWMIIEQGSGEKAKTEQFASMEYKIFLLDGSLIYASEEKGLKSFLIGQGSVEKGLEEGVLFLKRGDKARFILPSHLAFGLQGDGNLIPEKAVLLYEVKLIDLK